MYDKILAAFSLTLFVVFLGILAYWVPDTDLRIVLVITCAMATYDFWLDAFRRNAKKDH